MLGTVARWTVPTVVTMTLGARLLEAKASCPPCQKKVGATCKACSVSQMLNCQCEPCLGPPYCSAVGPVAPFQPGNLQAPGSQGLQGAAPGQGATGGTKPPNYLDIQRERQKAARDPFHQQLYPDPFGMNRNRNDATPGLYQRLRPDSARRTP
jgi:hypothetical protein